MNGSYPKPCTSFCLNATKTNQISDRLENSKLEDLKGYSRTIGLIYQLQTFIQYKAKLVGVPVLYIEPAYTSQMCSKCGLMEDRNGKEFKCSNCGNVGNADFNTTFNIASKHISIHHI